MEQNNIHKERINYVKNIIDDRGIEVLTGKSVNYPQITVSGDTEEELKEEATTMIKMWLQYGTEQMAQEDPVELHHIEDGNEWLHQPNIDYWEIEKIKHLLRSRTTMRTWLMNIIVPIIATGKLEDAYSDDTAYSVIEAIINYEQ